MARIDRPTAAAVALFVGMFTGGLSAQQIKKDIPANPFVRPTGYAIGTYEWLWIDGRRSEPYTRDTADRRRLPIRVWYPADSQPGAPTAPYIVAPAEFGTTSTFKAVEHVLTNAVTGAPVAKAQRKYPVLLYNHGAGWPRFTGTFVTELMASQGYVVIGIDHPGLDRTVLFSDGVAFKPDTLTMPAPDLKDMRSTMSRSMAFLNEVAFPIWLDDSRFVLDRVAALNRDPGPFRGRLDLNRIGMLGWSFGGATAIEMARIDRRVKAAVNHDGRLFGGAMSEPVSRPFMLFHHGIDDAASAPEANRPMLREMMLTYQGYDSVARARATRDWYDLTIARTNHGHFSDLPLFMSMSADSTLLDGRRAHQIIAAYTLAFFDRYLKGRQSPLLQAPSADMPEVAFRRK